MRRLLGHLELTIRPSRYDPPREFTGGDWLLFVMVGLAGFALGVLVGLGV
jgi:hypothetical protein